MCRGSAPGTLPLDSLLVSTLVVAAAEIGDKTQLLSLLLSIRFQRPWPICWGIVLATAVNHAAAALLGDAISQALGPDLLRYLLAASFLLMGLWLLRPDRLDERAGQGCYGGVLLTAATLFFVAEIGDKTQVATVALGARFESVAAVVMGTTLGMLVANVPVVFGGRAVIRWLPVRAAQRLGAALFVLLGALTLLSPWLGHWPPGP